AGRRRGARRRRRSRRRAPAPPRRQRRRRPGRPRRARPAAGAAARRLRGRPAPRPGRAVPRPVAPTPAGPAARRVLPDPATMVRSWWAAGDGSMGGRIGGLLAVAVLVAAGAAPAGAAQQQPRTDNTELVGHLDPGPGVYGDVWVHKDVAYLGSYRSSRCGTAPVGVWAVDVRDPAKPRALGQFGAFRG